MKSLIIVAAGLLLLAAPAMAQSPTSNATAQGTETTAGNGQGAPSAATPAGQIKTTGIGGPAAPSASPPAVASMGAQSNGAVPQALNPTPDSSVTGTTTVPK